MVGAYGHTERLINNMHYMNLEYLFTDVYKLKILIYDFIKHVRTLQMGTNDTLQARIGSILT